MYKRKQGKKKKSTPTPKTKNRASVSGKRGTRANRSGLSTQEICNALNVESSDSDDYTGGEEQDENMEEDPEENRDEEDSDEDEISSDTVC